MVTPMVAVTREVMVRTAGVAEVMLKENTRSDSVGEDNLESEAFARGINITSSTVILYANCSF